MNLLTGYFPIFKKILMKKSQNFFIIFFAKIFRYDKKYPASQHPDVSRFNYSQYGSFTDSSITRRGGLPGTRMGVSGCPVLLCLFIIQFHIFDS